MKKHFKKIIILVLLLFIGLIITSAKEIDLNDFDSGTFIINNYEIKADTAITTELLKKILKQEGKELDLSKVKIYYKSSNTSWYDASTKKKIKEKDLPETFTIGYTVQDKEDKGIINIKKGSKVEFLSKFDDFLTSISSSEVLLTNEDLDFLYKEDASIEDVKNTIKELIIFFQKYTSQENVITINDVSFKLNNFNITNIINEIVNNINNINFQNGIKTFVNYKVNIKYLDTDIKLDGKMSFYIKGTLSGFFSKFEKELIKIKQGNLIFDTGSIDYMFKDNINEFQTYFAIQDVLKKSKEITSDVSITINEETYKISDKNLSTITKLLLNNQTAVEFLKKGKSVFTKYSIKLLYKNSELEYNGNINLYPPLELRTNTEGTSIEQSYKVMYGSHIDKLLFRNPVKEGHTFIGWYFDKELTKEFLPFDLIENTTFYSKFEINKYKITYDTKGGSKVDPIIQNYGTKIKFPIKPTKQDYTFAGWFIDEELKNEITEDYIVTSDITLYAKWKKNFFEVTFLDYDGKELKKEIVDRGKNATPPEILPREGYTFIGWDKDYTNVISNLIITAQYKINQYTITYDTNGGTKINPTIQNYGTKIILPKDPEKEGYIFEGWFEDKEYTKELASNYIIVADITIYAKFKKEIIIYHEVIFKDYNGDILKLESVREGEDATPPQNPTREGHTFSKWDRDYTNITKDLIVTAVYQINKYTITFNSNGGSKVDAITLEYGSKFNASQMSVKKGSAFHGWYLDASLKNEVPNNYIVKSSIILYAKWKTKAEVLIGEDIIESMYLVNRKYNSNNIKNDVINANIPFKINGSSKTLDSYYDIKFYDERNNKEINNFNFPNGGTTYKVYAVFKSKKSGYENFSAYIVFKYASVTIGNNTNYYTIEDALQKSKSGDTIIVKYNTEFSNLKDIYKSNNYEIKSGVKLLLPYDNKYSEITNKTPGSSTGSKIDRNKKYVNLTIPKDIDISIKGTLIVNAEKASSSTRFNNHVNGAKYSTINLGENSKINIEKNGKLLVSGFIYGKGKVIAKSNSYIEESLFIKSFRGGSATQKIHKSVFPFNQFSANNIESELEIYPNSKIEARTMIYMNSSYYKTDVKLVGNTTNYVLQFTKGILRRKFDEKNGEAIYTIDNGEININDISIKLSGFNAGSSGKDIPFDGTWNFEAVNNSIINTNANLKFLPGSKIYIDKSSKFNITKNTQVTIFNPYNVIEDYSTYPNAAAGYYRVEPTFNYNKKTNAIFKNDGIINVKGSLAGIINNTGKINFESGSKKSHKMGHVIGSGDSARAHYYNVEYIDNKKDIIVVAHLTDAVKSKKIDITLYSINYNQDLSLTLTSSRGGSFNKNKVNLPKDGSVTITYTAPSSSGITTLTFTDSSNNVKKSYTLDVLNKEPSDGCPLIYSSNGNEIFLEHEPVPSSILKTFEGTTYGTIRNLTNVAGKYHLIVTEEMPTETYINEVNLYSVSYEKGIGIKNIFVDRAGKVHTIKDKIKLKSQKRISDYLEYYEAKIKREDLQSDIIKFMFKARGNEIVGTIGQWVAEELKFKNNVWWIDKLLSKSSFTKEVANALDITHINIELWDGKNWILQSKLDPGSTLLEEFLIPINIKDIDPNIDTIKIRLSSGKEFFTIKDFSYDSSKNENYKITELSKTLALKGDTNVTNLLNKKDEHIKLTEGEQVDIYFNPNEKDNDLEYGFFVEFTGYFYGTSNIYIPQNEKELENLNLEEFLNYLAKYYPESIPVLHDLNELIDFFKKLEYKNLNEKVKEILLQKVIPWLES